MSSPFNEEKYKVLLEGLEISEVWLHKLNDELRIDAEYYQKEYIFEDNSLQKFKVDLLGNHSFVTDGQHGYYEADPNSNIRMLAAKNCKDYFANTIDSMPLAKWVDDKNKRSSLQNGDIILSTRGSVGCCAIVYEEVLPANINQDVARIKLLNTNDLIPEFIIAYLNCKYGQHWMLRNQTGMVQQGLPLDKVRAIPIPFLEKLFQVRIEQIVKSAHSNLQQSKSLYSEAEDILLSELSLKGWHSSNSPINIKQLKGSFLTSGRLDAEYYQSKYDDLFSQLSKYECDTIKDIAHIKKSVEPGSEAYQDKGIPFVRVSDMTKFGISNPNIFLSPNDFDLKELQPKKNTILLSKDGSVGIAYKVEKDMDCITSGALLHLSIFNEEYNPDYLTLVLNSIVVQMQAERDSNGAIIQHWKPSEIEQVIIPKLPKPIQDTISAKIQESFALKAESKRLLEEAKIMVEKEIEKGGE